MGNYYFGPFRLDAGRRLLLRDNKVIQLTPKALDILQLLIEHQGQIVEKEQIIKHVWHVWNDTVVEESNLSVNISALRKALDEQLPDQRSIVTHSGRGYSFVSEVSRHKPLDRLEPLHISSIKKELNPNSPVYISEPVGGALPLDSFINIKRPKDNKLFFDLSSSPGVLFIHEVPHVGKSSLLARGLQYLREPGAKIILTDLQDIDGKCLRPIDKFLKTIIDMMAQRINLDTRTIPHKLSELEILPEVLTKAVEDNSDISLICHFERFLQNFVLTVPNSTIVWAIDELNRIFDKKCFHDVFRIFKSLYNKRALEPHNPWSKLCIIAAHTGANKIDEGIQIELKDFDLTQITELNSRYNSPVKNKEELKRIHSFVGGNPWKLNRCFWSLQE